jgi:hypothetical protein
VLSARLGAGGDEPLPYTPYTLDPNPSTPGFGYFRINLKEVYYDYTHALPGI